MLMGEMPPMAGLQGGNVPQGSNADNLLSFYLEIYSKLQVRILLLKRNDINDMLQM